MSTRNIYLLDTCVCIALLKKSPSVIQRLREVGTSNCRISDITLAELYFGAFKSGKEKHFNDVSEISKLFERFPIQYTRKYGEIRTIFVSQKGYHTAMLRHVLGETLGLSAYEPSYVSAS